MNASAAKKNHSAPQGDSAKEYFSSLLEKLDEVGEQVDAQSAADGHTEAPAPETEDIAPMLAEIRAMGAAAADEKRFTSEINRIALLNVVSFACLAGCWIYGPTAYALAVGSSILSALLFIRAAFR